MKKHSTVALTLFLFCLIARANDTTGSIASGGIQFTKTDAIKMQSEVLTISPNQIHVNYLFQNVTDKPVTSTVIFPLPPFDDKDIEGVYYPWDDEIAALNPSQDVLPFQKFSVIVKGKPVTYQIKIQAMLGHKDITALLKAHHIPLNPYILENNSLGETDDATPSLIPDAKYNQLKQTAQKLKLLDKDGNPLWQKQILYYWTQTFPAQQTITISHQYMPVTGESPNASECLDDALRKKAHLPDQLCINDFNGNDQVFDNAIAFKKYQLLDNKGEGICRQVQYILTTGANWAGPIEKFTLILHYPKSNSTVLYTPFYGNLPATITRKPGEVKIALAHFTPKQDLTVMFCAARTDGML